MARPWIFLDTHVPGLVRTAVCHAKTARTATRKVRASHALEVLAKLLSMSSEKKLGGVAVVRGPGSFSSVRAGVLMANVLAHAYDIPLVGLDVADVASIAQVAEQLHREGVRGDAYVAPVYDAEPNITLPTRSL